ncbi:MAG: TlpA family protein disulfide reductase [Vulcanimicrobiaceae bacterium]
MVLIALAALSVAASPSAAKHRALTSTGLRAVAYGKVPPDFRFDAGNGSQRLRELTGKPVVLNFWASWCGPCRAEMSALTQLQATYGDAVRLITLSDEPGGAARKFLSAQDLDLPLVEDPQRTIFSAYSIEAVPVTLVLGKDGTVLHVSVGQLDWAELHDAVERALAGRGAST